ncbi:putative phosphoglycerate mutase [Silvimonas terrae]|uniref:Putative phosphoglycerate mutase n=1 Tax=Silvimonas terrae TaxID=300266 RepID=A0A840RFC0_9NEIS|nr:histidine phosphatase family protein [Silvimonas terrae]MBB5191100.1 putative phosphoglycerate mutase [Silvimonas terrae]
MTTTLWLIRHGETAWNAAGRMQGHTDIPLNETGLEQAAMLGTRLALEHARQPFGAFCVSDLTRARQTAEPASALIGLPLLLDPQLRERNYGILEGLTRAEIATEQPEASAAIKARQIDYQIPDGESIRQFADRVDRVLRGIAQAHAGQQVLVVCHGGVLDIAWRLATGQGLEVPREHTLLNASINRIAFDGAAFSVVKWGDVSHLDPGILE